MRLTAALIFRVGLVNEEVKLLTVPRDNGVGVFPIELFSTIVIAQKSSRIPGEPAGFQRHPRD